MEADFPSPDDGMVPAAPVKKKKNPAPKTSTFLGVNRDAYEAEQEEKLEAAASAYPGTGRGAKGGKALAERVEGVLDSGGLAEEYPFCAISVPDFLELTEWQPHQDLKTSLPLRSSQQNNLHRYG